MNNDKQAEAGQQTELTTTLPTKSCLTLMSVSSTPVLSAYSITLGWAENSHHRHDDLALKYRLLSSSRTFCILMGQSVTLNLVWLVIQQVTPASKNKNLPHPLPTVHSFAAPLSLATRTSPKTWGLTTHSREDGISTSSLLMIVQNSWNLLEGNALFLPGDHSPGADAGRDLSGVDDLQQTRFVSFTEPPNSTQVIQPHGNTTYKQPNACLNVRTAWRKVQNHITLFFSK